MFSGHGSVGGEQVKMKKFGFLRVDLLRGRLWHGQTSTWRNKILALSKKKSVLSSPSVQHWSARLVGKLVQPPDAERPRPKTQSQRRSAKE